VIGSQIDGHAVCITVVSVQGDAVAVDLAGAVGARALDEQDVGVVEAGLEVDGSAAGLVQAAWVVDIDGLAATLEVFSRPGLVNVP
jgi:hypothetical protein